MAESLCYDYSSKANMEYDQFPLPSFSVAHYGSYVYSLLHIINEFPPYNQFFIDATLDLKKRELFNAILEEI